MNRSDRVALVIPARDEARFLMNVLRAVPPEVWRVFLVDDASRDGTAEIMRAWGDPRGECLRSTTPLGVGGAIQLGYARALECGAGVAAVVAADAQMDLAELPRVVAPVVAGEADYVQGCRFDRGRARGAMPPLRRLGNRVLTACTRWALGERVGDSQCGYTAASPACLRRLDPRRIPPGYGFPAFVRLEAHRLGLRVAEVPVRAIYGSEVSGIRPWRDPALIAARILWRGCLRRCEALPRWRRAAAGSARAVPVDEVA